MLKYNLRKVDVDQAIDSCYQISLNNLGRNSLCEDTPLNRWIAFWVHHLMIIMKLSF